MRSNINLRSYFETRGVQPHEVFNDGVEWVVPCRCDAGTDGAHLCINVAKGVGICHRCKTRYSSVDIVRVTEGCTLAEALRVVEAGAAPTHKRMAAVVETLRKCIGARATVADSDSELPSVSLPLEFRLCKRASETPRYITEERKISIRDCKFYCIGWCDSGFYRDRVIVPVVEPGGSVVSFVARYMGRPPKGVQKVLYPKGSRTSKVLFNEEAASRFKRLVVCEGVFDAIRVGRRAVALFGKSASRDQVARLVSLGQTRRVTVLLDADAEREAWDLAHELSEVCPDVRLGYLPEGVSDPGEATSRVLGRAVSGAARVRPGALPVLRGVLDRVRAL